MSEDPHAGLRADCDRCAGLCCVVPEFAASADFAVDKPAGQPCHHLRPDFRCGIHDSLRERGFPGCTAYDCLGAGQQVVQVTFGGRDWTSPQVAAQMYPVFTIMRELHELIWYLTDALTRPPAAALHGELRRALDSTERLTGSSADVLLGLDLAAHRGAVVGLLRQVSELVRARSAGPRVDRQRADLIGRDLRGADLRGANLRGACLIGADLRRADLRAADLIGADLRAADLRGADITGSLFLTQFQVNAAKGDATTTLPLALLRPGHWTAQHGRARPAVAVMKARE